MLRAGIIEIIIAAALLSLSGPFIRMANLSSGAMAFVRSALPAAFLGIWLFFRDQGTARRAIREDGAFKKVPRRRLGRPGWLLFASALNAVRLLLFFEAYRLISLGNAILILYTWPAFALLFSYFILGEKVVLWDMGLLFLGFIGIYVLYSGRDISFRDQNFLGLTLMLASAAIYALMLVLIRREGIDRLRAAFWQNLLGGFIFLPAFLTAVPSASWASWGWALANGFFVGTAGFVLLFSAFGKLPAVVVSHFSYLEVVFALIWAFSLFHEPFTWRLLLGGGLIVFSMMIRTEAARRSKKEGRISLSQGKPL